ncbi:MAG: A/G-specific adenine glycosylase [Pseudomonadota bacterium]
MSLPVPDLMSPENGARFASNLLDWYDVAARTLPWRTSPADRAAGIIPDPYHVWLSEVMLQQTTVGAVKAYFEAFITKWPTVNDLARAETDDVMKVWAGLGYYSRARNLKKCAEHISNELGGKFPDSVDGLLKLPGVGDYTASAIAAIAFDRQTAPIDGNFKRVYARLLEIEVPPEEAKAEINMAVLAAIPKDRPGDFVQALMDLGASICSPKTPGCLTCPVGAHCSARANGTALDYPKKKPKGEKRTRSGFAYVLVRKGDGAVFLQKRPEKGLLGGMSEVPGSDWHKRSAEGDSTMTPPVKGDWRSSGEITHKFTHFHLKLKVFSLEVVDINRTGGWWSKPNQLAEEALPTVMKKAIAAVLPDAFKQRSKS